MWIDFNADGVLSPSEWWQVGTNIPPGVATSIPITIPIGATPGQAVMRVRSRAAGNINGAVDPCTQFFSGESEDYIVTITGGASAFTYAWSPATFLSATDDDALKAAFELSKLEGIIPALETAHAVAALKQMKFKSSDVVVICLSGRGDKDLATYMKEQPL